MDSGDKPRNDNLIRKPEQHHVAVLDDVLLAFQAHLAGFLGGEFAAEGTKSSKAMVSARMKPFSKSVWMTPAACGALEPPVTVQARASFGPTVKKVMRSSTS